MKTRSLPALLLFLLLTSAISASAAPLPVWSSVTSSPTQSDVLGVAYGNGLFVAIAVKAEFLLSTDGTEWAIHRYPNRSLSLNDIAYGNGYFVAVGDKAPILFSGNGMGWKESYDATDRSLRSVAYCGNKFVAVGDGGIILTSPTGEAWTVRSTGTTRSLYTVTCSTNRIVAAGDGGTVLTSADGTTWKASNWSSDRRLQLNAAGHGPSGFVLAGSGTFGPTILHSPDGVTWKQGELPAGHSMTTLGHTGDSYTAFGLNARQEPVALTSNDGFRWSPMAGPLFGGQSPANQKYALNDVTTQGPALVAVGSHGVILRAPSNRPAWAPPVKDRTIKTLAFGTARFAAVTVGGDLMVSPDLQAWTVSPLRTESATSFKDVAYGNGVFVAVGERGAIAASNTDGQEWKQFQFGEQRLNAVTFANGRFVAAGDEGTLLWGDNGYTWSRVPLKTSADFTTVMFVGGRFVVSGPEGAPFTSFNGTDWSEVPWQSYSVARFMVDSPAVIRLEIRKEGTPVADGFRSGESYRFVAYGYDSAGQEIGPVPASWSIVYKGMTLPASGNAPVATVDQAGNFTAFGRGPVTIRAAYRGMTSDHTINVVPAEAGQVSGSVPPFFPNRFPSFSMELSPGVRQSSLQVGVTYKLTAYGVTAGGRITGEVLKPFWCLSNLDAASSARAILDSEGNLTILEPGTVHVGAVFGNGGQYMMVTATR